MLAARDQENLVHGHQAAAASKPLNHGIRQLQPKTPGNKVPKTPFKIPLNDENGGFGNGGGKTGLKLNGKGNENFMTGGKKGGLGDKNAFITPLGPRTRAPLGLKTTNAKAKAFQTPAPAPVDNDLDKATQKSATARKPKPRVSHAEMIKLDVLGDEDVLEEREIEYMPPPAKDLPYLPDDMPHDLDLSMFANGGLTRGYMHYFENRPDSEGLSYVQRKQIAQQELYDQMDKRHEAMILRDVESVPFPCTHFPDCPGDECKDTTEQKKKAEEKYQKTIESLEKKPEPVRKKAVPPKGPPPTATSKRAASILSQPKPTTALSKTAIKAQASSKSKLSSSSTSISSKKKTPPPTNPSPMRHTASTAVSKTTMGYSKGRVASANLRKTILPSKAASSASEIPDTTLAPAVYIQRYGVPPFGSEIWSRCKASGCFDEDGDDEWEEGWRSGAADLLREEAERDFELTW